MKISSILIGMPMLLLCFLGFSQTIEPNNDVPSKISLTNTTTFENGVKIINGKLAEDQKSIINNFDFTNYRFYSINTIIIVDGYQCELLSLKGCEKLGQIFSEQIIRDSKEKQLAVSASNANRKSFPYLKIGLNNKRIIDESSEIKKL